MDHSYIDKNVARIRAEIDEACRNEGLPSDGITLMAAIKSADIDEINYLHRVLGFNDVGENRVQQLLEHYDAIKDESLRIHFIGTLQTNKVKYIVDKVSMIQSLDSTRLAEEINRRCEKIGKRMDVLIEINSGHEDNKSGISPEEASAFAQSLEAYKNLRLCGFMTMAPRCEDDAQYRKYFGDTRQLCSSIWKDVLHREDDMILSMGMSDSYIPAVCEGSTLVRVGRGLFKKPDGENISPSN